MEGAIELLVPIRRLHEMFRVRVGVSNATHARENTHRLHVFVPSKVV